MALAYLERFVTLRHAASRLFRWFYSIGGDRGEGLARLVQAPYVIGRRYDRRDLTTIGKASLFE